VKAIVSSLAVLDGATKLPIKRFGQKLNFNAAWTSSVSAPVLVGYQLIANSPKVTVLPICPAMLYLFNRNLHPLAV
jgi:hypothetical protein